MRPRGALGHILCSMAFLFVSSSTIPVRPPTKDGVKYLWDSSRHERDLKTSRVTRPRRRQEPRGRARGQHAAGREAERAVSLRSAKTRSKSCSRSARRSTQSARRSTEITALDEERSAV